MGIIFGRRKADDVSACQEHWKLQKLKVKLQDYCLIAWATLMNTRRLPAKCWKIEAREATCIGMRATPNVVVLVLWRVCPASVLGRALGRVPIFVLGRTRTARSPKATGESNETPGLHRQPDMGCYVILFRCAMPLPPWEIVQSVPWVNDRHTYHPVVKRQSEIRKMFLYADLRNNHDAPVLHNRHSSLVPVVLPLLLFVYPCIFDHLPDFSECLLRLCAKSSPHVACVFHTASFLPTRSPVPDIRPTCEDQQFCA